jgi:hypothetical protein
MYIYIVPHKAVSLNATSVQDHQFSASSEEKLFDSSASEARMSGKGWCSYEDKKCQYLRLKFSKTVKISKVSIAGSVKKTNQKQGWVTRLEMSYFSPNGSRQAITVSRILDFNMLSKTNLANYTQFSIVYTLIDHG